MNIYLIEAAALYSHPAAPWWVQAIDQAPVGQEGHRTGRPGSLCGLSYSKM